MIICKAWKTVRVDLDNTERVKSDLGSLDALVSRALDKECQLVLKTDAWLWWAKWGGWEEVGVRVKASRCS